MLVSLRWSRKTRARRIMNLTLNTQQIETLFSPHLRRGMPCCNTLGFEQLRPIALMKEASRTTSSAPCHCADCGSGTRWWALTVVDHGLTVLETRCGTLLTIVDPDITAEANAEALYNKYRASGCSVCVPPRSIATVVASFPPNIGRSAFYTSLFLATIYGSPTQTPIPRRDPPRLHHLWHPCCEWHCVRHVVLGRRGLCACLFLFCSYSNRTYTDGLHLA